MPDNYSQIIAHVPFDDVETKFATMFEVECQLTLQAAPGIHIYGDVTDDLPSKLVNPIKDVIRNIGCHIPQCRVDIMVHRIGVYVDANASRSNHHGTMYYASRDIEAAIVIAILAASGQITLPADTSIWTTRLSLDGRFRGNVDFDGIEGLIKHLQQLAADERS